jgi:phospholipid/cholesterol/gamma-HCH transport system substrate-binding protein
MKRSSVETSVGIFMFIGIICIGYLTIHLGKMDWMGNNNYTLYARFQSVAGLKPGASVEMAGVQIGQIDSISLDQEKEVALVKLKIQKGIMITDDAIASVKTSGLIGDKYIMISPGGSDRILRPGEMITETEPAVDLEDLISKYVFGSAK